MYNLFILFSLVGGTVLKYESTASQIWSTCFLSGTFYYSVLELIVFSLLIPLLVKYRVKIQLAVQ